MQFSKPRYVRHDVTIDGVGLKQGDRVIAMLGAANMDPAANACPHGGKHEYDDEARPVQHGRFYDPAYYTKFNLGILSDRDLRMAVLNIEQARAQYDIRPGFGENPRIDEMLITCPLPRALKCESTSCMP